LMLATSCWMTGFITLSNIRWSSTPPPKPPTLTLTLLSSPRASSAQRISPVLVSIRRALTAATKLRLPAEKLGSRPMPGPWAPLSVTPYSVTDPVSVAALAVPLVDRLFLGGIAIGFVLWRTLRRERSATPGRPSVVKGAFWATLSGLTSFIAHSGGPPLSVYLLPLRLAPSVLVGTVAVLFAALNWAKVLPYWWLGLFSAQNLLTSAALAPVGVAGVALGVWLHKRVSETLFYRLVYAFLLLTGAKLLYDGFS